MWKWCAGWFDSGYYTVSPTDDPTGPATGSKRVRRGGIWNFPADFCRLASRFSRGQWYGFHGMGLRLCSVTPQN
ncbi:MAG: SUMF1/EgtB/PvdO family nonheme iron enzyme [Thermoguttaceae bacterium]